MLGFFAWMILKGWVKEITVSMMMVGHTHEDIDAVFKRIVEEWKRQGKVLCPDDFYQMLRSVSGDLRSARPPPPPLCAARAPFCAARAPSAIGCSVLRSHRSWYYRVRSRLGFLLCRVHLRFGGWREHCARVLAAPAC